MGHPVSGSWWRALVASFAFAAFSLSAAAQQVITLHGYLVEVRANDGWHWRSSLTRNDTGNGACELVWVESVEIGAAG